MSRIKAVFTDIDGVWTDGGMYYDQSGNELKRFHTYDGVGVRLAHQHGIKVGIITGEDTRIVTRRAEKLNVDFLYQGVNDKFAVLQEICRTNRLNYDEVAYIGDDINDMPILVSDIFSATPCTAPLYIQSCVNKVLQNRGGDGVFREFVEYIICQINQEKIKYY